jgi:hypothetical protein
VLVIITKIIRGQDALSGARPRQAPSAAPACTTRRPRHPPAARLDPGEGALATGDGKATGHGREGTDHEGCLRLKMTLTCGSHMSVVEWSCRHGHNRNFPWRCLRGVWVPTWQVVVACHISEKGNCEWVLKQEWQMCRGNRKNGFRVLAVRYNGKNVKSPVWGAA